MTTQTLDPRDLGSRMETLSTVISWHFQDRTPDLIGAFAASSETTNAIAVAVGRYLQEADIDGMIEWLRGDTLDWDAVERGDAWAD